MNKLKSFLVIAVNLLGSASFALAQGIGIPKPPGVPDNFNTLLLNIGKGVGTIIGSLGALMIVVAGILFLTSAGAPAKIDTAKKALLYAVIGIVIGALAGPIIELVQGWLK